MIKLKDLLSEGKYKFKGKYLYMPGGKVTSIPGERDRDAVIFNHPRFGELKIWQQKGKIYMLGDDFDKYVEENFKMLDRGDKMIKKCCSSHEI